MTTYITTKHVVVKVKIRLIFIEDLP